MGNFTQDAFWTEVSPRVRREMADYARDEPVYQFDSGLMQQLASRRIGSTTIESGQVVVHLDQ